MNVCLEAKWCALKQSGKNKLVLFFISFFYTFNIRKTSVSNWEWCSLIYYLLVALRQSCCLGLHLIHFYLLFSFHTYMCLTVIGTVQPRQSCGLNNKKINQGFALSLIKNKTFTLFYQMDRILYLLTFIGEHLFQTLISLFTLQQNQTLKVYINVCTLIIGE